jgi:hypothetical protein
MAVLVGVDVVPSMREYAVHGGDAVVPWTARPMIGVAVDLTLYPLHRRAK